MPCATLEKDLVRKKLVSLAAELERLEAQLDSPAKASLMGKVRMKMSMSELRLKQLEEELDSAREDLKDQDGGRMECGVAYAGTEINMGDEFLRLRQETHQCVAKLLCGEIADVKSRETRKTGGGRFTSAACSAVFPLFSRALSRLHVLDKGPNLGNHVVHILKHGALGGAQAAGLVDVLDDLLILGLDLVKELAKHRQLLLGHLNDPGDLRLHGGGALCRRRNLMEAVAMILRKLSSVWPTTPTPWFRVCWEDWMLLLRSPARVSTSHTPVSTSPASCLISLASSFTWAATTAKPFPSTPARAASMEALMARMLVWSAMETIFPMHCWMPRMAD